MKTKRKFKEAEKKPSDETMRAYWKEQREKDPEGYKKYRKNQYRDNNKDKILYKCDDFLDYFGYKRVEKSCKE